MKLQINHLTWNIIGTDSSDQNLLGKESEYTFGITYFDRTCAYIRTDLPEELVRRTVRHELTHMTEFPPPQANVFQSLVRRHKIC
ncbi:MAG: hypothetical protein LKK26_08280 [Solobacterium sp.]|jgi:hypothetical protein|nr:hypothetical protein [Solobacterium sp.]